MFRVYVDEAGNRTISPASSRYFVVSAVMVHESHNAMLPKAEAA